MTPISNRTQYLPTTPTTPENQPPSKKDLTPTPTSPAKTHYEAALQAISPCRTGSRPKGRGPQDREKISRKVLKNQLTKKPSQTLVPPTFQALLKKITKSHRKTIYNHIKNTKPNTTPEPINLDDGHILVTFDRVEEEISIKVEEPNTQNSQIVLRFHTGTYKDGSKFATLYPIDHPLNTANGAITVPGGIVISATNEYANSPFKTGGSIIQRATRIANETLSSPNPLPDLPD